VPERQRRQWDIASFVAATAALTLSTYNTLQISKLETAIEKQQQKTDLITDIVHIHEQHLHQLDTMIKNIGNEIQKLKIQAGFYFSVDRAIAQVISDSNKLRAVVAIFEQVINSAFDQKLALGALSVDVLHKIVNHIKDTAAQNKFHNFIHQLSYLYKVETSFIHRPEEHTVILILHIPYVETEKLKIFFLFTSSSLYLSISTSPPTYQSFRTSVNKTSSPLATPKPSRLSPHRIWPTASVSARLSSARVTRFFKPTLSATAWALST